jgi:hypothetical protein
MGHPIFKANSSFGARTTFMTPVVTQRDHCSGMFKLQRPNLGMLRYSGIHFVELANLENWVNLHLQTK